MSAAIEVPVREGGRVTVPAEAMVGRLTGPMLALALSLALGLLVGGRLFWKCGVKRYSGASA